MPAEPKTQKRLVSGTSLAFFKTFIKRYPRDTITALSAFLMAGILESIGITAMLPLLSIILSPGQDMGVVGDAVDFMFGLVNMEVNLVNILMLIVIVITAKALLMLYAMNEVGFITAVLGQDLRIRLIHNIVHARWDFFRTMPLGKSANAVGVEIERASLAYYHMCKALSDAILVAVYILFAFFVSWQIALTAMTIGVLIAYSLKSLVRMARNAGEKQTILFSSLLANMTDSLSGIKGIKAMGRENHFINILNDEIKSLTKAKKQEVSSSQILYVIKDPILAVLISLCLYITFTFTQTPFATILVIAALFYRVVSKVTTLQFTYQKMASMESAYWALEQTINDAGNAREQVSGDRAAPLNKAITVKNLTFGFADAQDKPLLKDLSIEFPAYSINMLAGASGSGKTTLVDLILRLYEPQSGEILIDSEILSSVDKLKWRQSIGYVPQECVLLHDSIRNNITLGNTNLSDDDITLALQKAMAWDFIQALPDGLDTTAGERGQRFSGGQRQRISIARALATKPQLLILDEPTSALDETTQREFFEIISKLKESMTVIVITHSTAMSSYADHLFLMENGTLVKKPAQAAA